VHYSRHLCFSYFLHCTNRLFSKAVLSWFVEYVFVFLCWVRVMVMIFNATFNNNFIISWGVSFCLAEETTDVQLINFIISSCIECTSSCAGIELTTLVVISTDCICRCRFIYHMYDLEYFGTTMAIYWQNTLFVCLSSTLNTFVHYSLYLSLTSKQSGTFSFKWSSLFFLICIFCLLQVHIIV
jgi:hypothetical protein